MSKLDDVIEKVNQMHECLTGGMKPEEGLLGRVQKQQEDQNHLRNEVKEYHKDDDGMHRFIKRWLWAITGIIVVGFYGDKIQVDPALMRAAFTAFFHV
jgi:hypothetical protein